LQLIDKHLKNWFILWPNQTEGGEQNNIFQFDYNCILECLYNVYSSIFHLMIQLAFAAFLLPPVLASI